MSKENKYIGLVKIKFEDDDDRRRHPMSAKAIYEDGACSDAGGINVSGYAYGRTKDAALINLKELFTKMIN